jgi:pimeloyl-ACP methyl ester carboxylesterase
MSPLTGRAAGVPYLAVPPSGTPAPDAPVVFAWHLMDAPRTEAAFAAALPLAGLPAWRIYLGLPMFGARQPEGGLDEVFRLASIDAVRNVYQPIMAQVIEEFPAALAELRERLGLGSGPVALVGGSAGSAAALIVLVEAGIPVDAAVLVSPVVALRPVIEANGRQFGVTYPWDEESGRYADRLDFVARADEIAAAGQPALRFVVGAEDDRAGFREPAERLRAALAERYADPSRVDLIMIPGMGHALAEEPGVEPAPQTSHAAAVDRQAVDWLRLHLGERTHRTG